VTILARKPNGRIVDQHDIATICSAAQTVVQVATKQTINPLEIMLEECSAVQLADSERELQAADRFALSAMENCKGNTAAARLHAEQGLQTLDTSYETMPGSEIAAKLMDAQRIGVDLSQFQSRLQSMRQIHRSDQPPAEIAVALDEAMLVLARGGHVALAGLLLTASDREPEHLQAHGNAEARPIIDTLLAMHAKKQATLRQTLTDTGVSVAIQDSLLATSSDPEHSMQLGQAFWEMFNGLDDEVQQSLIAATSLSLLERTLPVALAHGTLNDLGDIANRLAKLSDQTDMEAYCVQYAAVADALEAAPDSAVTSRDFIDFPDPLRVYDVVLQLSNGSPQSQHVRLFRYMHAQDKYTGEYVDSYDPSLYSMVAELQSYVDANHPDSQRFVELFSDKLRRAADPVAYSTAMLTALEILDTEMLFTKHVPNHFFLLNMIAADPVEAADAWVHIVREFPDEPADFIQELHAKAVFWETHSPLAHARATCMAEKILQQEGFTLEDLPAFVRLGFVQNLMQEDAGKSVETLRAFLEGERHSRAVRDRMLHEEITIAHLPDIKEYFAKTGIDAELAERLFVSWITYNPDRTYGLEDHKNARVSDQIMESTAEARQDRMRKYLEAAADYIEQYGAEEFTEIVTTFGIHNFHRYPKMLLHGQLELWRNPVVRPSSIVITAHDDWNDAFRSIGQHGNPLNSGTTFYFEVNNPAAAGKALIAVGNRERRAGRDPRRDSRIEHVFVSAHANPAGMLFGRDGGLLHVDDFENAAAKRQNVSARPNNYRRHIGGAARFVLKACSAAKDVSEGVNIAQALSQGHGNLTVVAANAMTYGSLIVNGDASISFRVIDEYGDREVVPGRVYGDAVRLDAQTG
jgi:hypothetical protein